MLIVSFKVIIRHLWFGIGLKEAINDKRLHHQLFPMYIEFESVFENVMKRILLKSSLDYLVFFRTCRLLKDYQKLATITPFQRLQDFQLLRRLQNLLTTLLALTIIDDLVKWHTSNLFYNT